MKQEAPTGSHEIELSTLHDLPADLSRLVGKAMPEVKLTMRPRQAVSIVFLAIAWASILDKKSL